MFHQEGLAARLLGPPCFRSASQPGLAWETVRFAGQQSSYVEPSGPDFGVEEQLARAAYPGSSTVQGPGLCQLAIGGAKGPWAAVSSREGSLPLVFAPERAWEAGLAQVSYMQSFHSRRFSTRDEYYSRPHSLQPVNSPLLSPDFCCLMQVVAMAGAVLGISCSIRYFATEKLVR